MLPTGIPLRSKAISPRWTTPAVGRMVIVPSLPYETSGLVLSTHVSWDAVKPPEGYPTQPLEMVVVGVIAGVSVGVGVKVNVFVGRVVSVSVGVYVDVEVFVWVKV